MRGTNSTFARRAVSWMRSTAPRLASDGMRAGGVSASRQERHGPNGDSLGPPDGAEPLAALRAHRGADAPAHWLPGRCKGRDEIGRHRFDVAAERWSLGRDHDVDVLDPPAVVPQL